MADQLRKHYPLQSLCKVLSVSTNGFAAWLACGGPTHWLSDAQLLALIRSVHTEVQGAYGSPRMYQKLKSLGHPVSKARVRRLMQKHGIRAHHKRRYKATTNSKHSMPVAPNVLDRQFSTAVPDTVWTADITYIPTREGWLYLAVVMDLHTRAIVGWAMDERMTNELVINALLMAVRRRQPKQEVLVHSDQGSQFSSYDWRDFLKAHRLVPSMSRRGNCHNNAVAESFFQLLKRERIRRRIYANREEARRDVFDYIELFYNPKRRHGSSNGLSPVEYERQHFQRLAGV